VVAVPEEVVADVLADGGGDAVAEDGDLEEARAAASSGGLREAVAARVHHHVVEEAVDVHEDEQRVGVLGPQRRQLLHHPGVVCDGDLVVALRAAPVETAGHGALRRDAADGRDADEGDAARTDADEVLDEGGGVLHQEARVGGVVVAAARSQGEVGVGHVVAAGADGEDAPGQDIRHPGVPGGVAHLAQVVVEHGELVRERDHGGELRRERVEARAAGREADAGDEVVLVERLGGEVGRQKLLDAEAGGDEVGGYPAVAEPSRGSVVLEVGAVGREVGLDDGADVVVVAGVHDGVAEHDEGRRQRLLLLLPTSRSRGVDTCCCISGNKGGERDEHDHQQDPHAHARKEAEQLAARYVIGEEEEKKNAAVYMASWLSRAELMLLPHI
jgi:hypothetical protein